MTNHLDGNYYKLAAGTLVCLRCPVPGGCVYDLQGAAGICPLGVPPDTNAARKRRQAAALRSRSRRHHERIADTIKTEILPLVPITIPELVRARGVGVSSDTIYNWARKGYFEIEIRPGRYQKRSTKVIVGPGKMMRTDGVYAE